MYIKSVIIDGFKSYGRRTEIHGFDSEFTAITGLNGTGKSNILDSICFVLGIMNLGQVRATSLQDLVYKSGQAGITKATVTLIFDNSNPSQCPLGYEKCREISVARQIVVGGKNKYMINGKLVQNKKVSDFFCSVQLNVNNPNFLIMQGRITKVLNMKPQEILSMIEEAAGTSLYETKREATTKLIEKKDAKVRETNTLLHEEVEPKLEKLRREKSAYMEYQKICRDIEYLTRIHISYLYLKYKDSLKSIEANIETLTGRIETAKQNIINNNDERERIKEKTKELQCHIDETSGGALREVETELERELMNEGKAAGNLKASQSTIDQEEKRLKSIVKSMEDDEKSLQLKQKEMDKAKNLFQNLKEADSADSLAYEETQKKYEAVSQGLSTNEDGQASSLQDQLINAKQSLSEAQTLIKTSDMELKHSRQLLRQKESETQTNDAAYTKDKNLHDKLQYLCLHFEINLRSFQVTYHPNIHCRSVTLDGDVVDPEGTLSGGSKPKGSNILQELGEIKRLENDIKERKREIQKIDQQLSSLENKARSYQKLKETIELRQHELDACKQRLAQTTFQQQQTEILSLKEHIKTLEDDLLKAQNNQKLSQTKIKDIESKLADAKGYRERELKKAGEAMKAAKQKAEKSRNNWKKHEQDHDTLCIEIDSLQKDITQAKEQRINLEDKIEKLKTEQEEMRNKNATVREVVAELRQKIKQQKDKINSQNKELKALFSKLEKLEKHNEEFNLEIKKKENEVNKVRTESKDSFKKIENLESKYPWINEDKEFFGMKNTRYDYSKENPVEAGQKLSSMGEQKEKMERNINLRAMVLLEREEENYQETIRRKKIVEQDKEKIKNIICKMDIKKREKVEKAWMIVDENFSSIFSTLLQGAQARLNPIKENNQLVGLEIKVGFNGIWKESLGELSGGQRSLVALSLVLAMLKFSPAPLYILDEVDAALDMSHTQNIGNMLKTHFTSSQFIIVSLKDGMFNNANVLFSTKFEEGVSAVTRKVNSRLQVARR
uniref:RecF/RecN/SMC N-terminal domain-containing protein n=1 Tax=Glossina palpalis gambiensis TaxID=67801 RepID=A0A1B0C4Z1_9MUSC